MLGDFAIKTLEATIANGEALSGIVDLGPYRLFGIYMPASWTAAGLSFQASPDGTNFADVYLDDDTELTISAAASRYISIASPSKMIPARWIKVRSGTTGAPVNQGGARTLTLIGVP